MLTMIWDSTNVRLWLRFQLVDATFYSLVKRRSVEDETKNADLLLRSPKGVKLHLNLTQGLHLKLTHPDEPDYGSV